MTRWPRRRGLGPIEFPAWVRVFEVAEWADPMADRQRSAEGAEWAARQRWCQARNRWLRERPAAARQAAEELAAFMSAPP